MGKARSSTSADAIRDDLAMHHNVQFMLVKLHMKADMPSCGTGHAEGSLVRSGFILNI